MVVARNVFTDRKLRGEGSFQLCWTPTSLIDLSVGRSLLFYDVFNPT